MATLTESNITVTILEHIKINKRRQVTAQLTFGNGSLTYPSGGISLTAGKFGMVRNIDSFGINMPGAQNLSWVWDRTNAKLRCITKPAPLLVVEKSITAVDGSGTFVGSGATMPAYIVAAEDNAGNVYDIIPAGETAGANELAFNFSTGAFTLGNATSQWVRFTYVPQHGDGLFNTGNITDAEQLTVASGTVTLAAQACAIQYIYNETDNSIVTPIPDDEAPADGECTVAFDSSGSTIITFNSADNGQTVTVRYILRDGLESISSLKTVADISLTTEVINFNTSTGYHGLVLPGYGTRFVSETGAGVNRLGRISGPSDVAASGVARWQPDLNRFTFSETGTADTINMPLLVISPEFIQLQSAREMHVSEAPAAQTLIATITGW